MKCGWGIRDRLCQRISSSLTKIVHTSLYEYCEVWDRFTAPQSYAHPSHNPTPRWQRRQA